MDATEAWVSEGRLPFRNIASDALSADGLRAPLRPAGRVPRDRRTSEDRSVTRGMCARARAASGDVALRGPRATNPKTGFSVGRLSCPAAETRGQLKVKSTITFTTSHATRGGRRELAASDARMEVGVAVPIHLPLGNVALEIELAPEARSEVRDAHGCRFRDDCAVRGIESRFR